MIALLRSVSWKDLSARPFRVGLFVVSIALGVGLVTATLLASDAVIRDFNSQVDRIAGRAQLQVTFGTGESRFQETLADRVKQAPMVERAAALVRGTLSFADGSGELLELFGVDLLEPEVQRLYDVSVVERTADDFTILNDPFGVFLTERVAAARGWKVGDRARLSSAVGVRDYTVRGIVRGDGLASSYGGQVAVMYLPAAQGVLGIATDGYDESPVDRIDIELKPGVAPEVAARALEALLPPQLTVSEPAQRKLANRRLVSGLRATLVGVSAFVLLAAVFIVYATTIALVTYRTPMLATLIRTGATPGAVVRLVVFEAALLGWIGGVLGTAMGIAMASAAITDVAAGMSLNYSLPFTVGRLAPSFGGNLAWLPWLGAVAAAGSAYGPSRRLRKLDLLALRNVGHAEDPRQFPTASYLGLGALLAGVALIVALIARAWNSPGASSAAAILLWPACIVVVLPVVRGLWVASRGSDKRPSPTSRWLAVGLLERNSERSLVAVAAIALSIGVVVAASTLPRSFRRSVAHWYAFYGDGVVTSRERQGGWLPAAVTRRYVDLLRGTPGVETVETLRVLQGQPYSGERIAIVSLSDGYLASALSVGVNAPEARAQTAIDRVRAGDAAVISENLSAHYALTTGDVLRLVSPSGPVAVPVAAVIPDFVSDRGSVIVGRSLFERSWGDPLVNYIAFSVKPDVSLDAVRRQFRQRVGADGDALSVLSIGELVSGIDDAIARAFADLGSLQLLVVLITVAGIVDLVVSGVFDSRGIQTTLRSIGMTDRGVVSVVVWQCALIGMTAGLAGAALGIVASWLWVHVAYPALVGYVLGLHTDWQTAAVCVALSVGTAICAGSVAGGFAVRRAPSRALPVG